MPLGKGVRFRVRTTDSGKKQRLAFKSGKVVEVQNLKKGKRGKLIKKGSSKMLGKL